MCNWLSRHDRLSLLSSGHRKQRQHKIAVVYHKLRQPD